MQCSFLGLILLAAISLLSQSISGQELPEEVLFNRISIPGTIRSSQVVDMVQDDMGLIWIAGDGLYRYDGFRFKQYKEVNNASSAIRPREIHQLLYDREKQRILLTANSFGILSYDYKTDQVTKILSDEKPPILTSMVKDEGGRVWSNSFYSGLFYLDNDSLKRFEDSLGLMDHPSCLVVDGTTLYVGLERKVAIVKNGKITGEIPIDWKGLPIPFNILPSCLFIDDQRQLWIGTEKHGVLVYGLDKKEFKKYFAPTQPPFFSRISTIRQDREGLIWILTKANGVVVYSPEKDKFLHLTRDPFSSRSISSDNCFSIVEDKDGVIWIGATGDINTYDRDQLKFRHILHNPLSDLSLSDNMVRGVYADKSGELWIGTDGGYINFIDLKRETIRKQRVTLNKSNDYFVPLYFFELNDRTMLICTTQGVLEYDRAERQLRPYLPLWQNTNRNSIRQIVRNGLDLFFISNGNLYSHNLQTGITKMLNDATEIGSMNITAIHLDSRKRLWAGSNKGLSLFDYKTETFRLFPMKGVPVAVDVPVLLILSINEIDDALYVGTYHSGLWVFPFTNDGISGAPKHLNDSTGFPSNTVYATVKGSDGNLWLSTNEGIVMHNPLTGKSRSFTVGEGVQEDEFNRLAYTQTPDGKIVFGGINGINVFDPTALTIPAETFRPKIIAVAGSNPLLKQFDNRRVTDFSKPLIFESEQNFINISFFVPHYEIPRRFSLFYKLENYDKDWIEVTSDNNATYSNLQPGQYTFLVKTVERNGDEQIERVSFSIKLPYWQTWWFILLAVLVIALLVSTIARSYVRKSLNDRHRLEQLLQIRTAEIEKSKEELQVLNQKKDLIFSILSHDLRSPLTTLKGFLGYIIDHAEDLSKEDLRRHAINIRNSVTNSLDLIDNTLFWSLSQMGTIQYTPTAFNLSVLLEKLSGLYQLTADKKKIKLSVNCERSIMVYGDENMIYVTLRNIVSNALKFTGEGKPVSIHCSKQENFVEIEVKDHGIGMSQEYLQRILSMDQPMLKKGTSNEKGTGLGLLLCKNFIEQNKGQLRIESVEHVGTTFTVILPLHVQEPSPVDS